MEPVYQALLCCVCAVMAVSGAKTQQNWFHTGGSNAQLRDDVTHYRLTVHSVLECVSLCLDHAYCATFSACKISTGTYA